MAITIKGIRIDLECTWAEAEAVYFDKQADEADYAHVTIERSEETGHCAIKEARYSLISSTDHVLASQSIGGYGGLSLKPSPQTIKLLEQFMQAYKADTLAVLGLDLD